jgi:hypothetical protein
MKNTSDMKKYKLLRCGNGTQVYRVVRNYDQFNMGITIAGEPWDSRDPWVMRWLDMFSTKQERRFMTLGRVREYLEVM